MPDKNMPDMSRDAMNAFPFWFEKIKHIESDVLKLPKSIYIPVPAETQRAFYMERPEDRSVIDDFVEHTVRPAMQAANIGLCFLKNGCYSHKFDAKSACLPLMSNLSNAVMTIMYEAMLRCGFQYDGTECLVVRERIQHKSNATPCIYNGLPFRPEYRVFYDFDTKKPIFTIDYWQKDYVYDKLYDLTDKLIFNAWYDGHIRPEFEKNQGFVTQAVVNAMCQADDLHGPWSVDIMQDEAGRFWLIDMAVAELSAYWERRPDSWKNAHEKT